MRSLTFLALALVPILGTSAAPRSWNVGQGVKTTNGLIKGHSSYRAPGVSEYLGIPYAEPPVGDLRWRHPRKLRKNAEYSADKFSPDCPAKLVGASPSTNSTSASSGSSSILSVLGQAGDAFSEDCLSLNIWTKPQVGERSKAVMLWIYGGGFTSGNSASPAYHGARIADEQDVVLVSINYRLNIFGFPHAPGEQEGNLGLLDQRVAVEWVRDNIAAFGGDPSRITLFGESAGGASVDIYSYAWLEDPIVNGFIAQSGTALLKGVMPTSNSDKAWYRVSRHLGCGGRYNGPRTIDCMRTKSVQDILDAISLGAGGSIMTDFAPRPDGKIVFDNYEDRAKNGRFIKKVSINKHDLAQSLIY
jgi:cholinesterase